MLMLYGESFRSRFLLGSALYPTLTDMLAAIRASKTDIVTVSLRRQLPAKTQHNAFWSAIQSTGCRVLPNTAGCHSAREAVTTAQLAREVFQTDWIKLEVIADDNTLIPDPFGLLEAAEQLVQLGFKVLPYCTQDPVLCERLIGVGCEVLMPLAAPIGTGQGISDANALMALRRQFSEYPMIIDAGIGAPSHAAKALELGFDAVLLNSAVALAQDQAKMADAFRLAIDAGRLAYEAGIMPAHEMASPSTPTVGRPFWHEDPVG